MDIWNKITHLSRLKLTDKEQELLIPQVKKIIEFFNNISHIPTDSIQPLISPIEKITPLRVDQVQIDISPEKLLSQSQQENQYIPVPLVISVKSDPQKS